MLSEPIRNKFCSMPQLSIATSVISVVDITALQDAFAISHHPTLQLPASIPAQRLQIAVLRAAL